MFCCNITGNYFNLEENENHREGGERYGYNCSFIISAKK